MKQKEILILAGPTGVGKSLAAVEVAEALGGEIIGADAFQVYKGMDILTAQPDADLRGRIPHHLIGCVSPQESFDTGIYSKLVEALIADVQARGKIPVVTGGAGLYIKVITHGLSQIPPVDPRLREELAALPLEELLHRLEKYDPQALLSIDRQNPRRVQRALEICLQTGTPSSSQRETWKQPVRPFRGVILTRDRDALHSRINDNVQTMVKFGVMEEIRRLDSVGLTARKAIGYEDAVLHLKGHLCLDKWIERTQQATRQFAKRQLTWFRNQTNFTMLNVSEISNIRDSLITAFTSPAAPSE